MVSLTRDVEALVAALRERGVDYLTPTDAKHDGPIDDASLVASLATHSDARLRQALIALFLLHPQLAPIVPCLLSELDEYSANELTAYYTAAMYLQTMWRTRLSYYLGPLVNLPDYFSIELALPPANDEYGKVGLYALADWHASHSAYRFNHLSAYQGVADLLFQSLKQDPVKFEQNLRALEARWHSTPASSAE